ncbi:MAG: class I lanthipeptide [Bacteroidales bacterium]
MEWLAETEKPFRVGILKLTIMEKKSLNKKLILNKETIANLNHYQMNGLKGGVDFTKQETCLVNCTLNTNGENYGECVVSLACYSSACGGGGGGGTMDSNISGCVTFPGDTACCQNPE